VLKAVVGPVLHQSLTPTGTPLQSTPTGTPIKSVIMLDSLLMDAQTDDITKQRHSFSSDIIKSRRGSSTCRSFSSEVTKEPEQPVFNNNRTKGLRTCKMCNVM